MFNSVMPKVTVPTKLNEVNGFDKLKLWMLHKLLKHRLAPMVMEKIRQAELQKVQKEVSEELNRPLDADRVATASSDKTDKIRVPVRFRRIAHRSRGCELQLTIDDETAKRIEETGFDAAMHNKTFDVIFLIPKGLMRLRSDK